MMWKKWLNVTQREYSPAQRLIALFFEGILFVILAPVLLVVASAVLDRWLGLPRLMGGYNQIAGLLLVILGWPLALWAIIVQFRVGRGTPVPLMATQKLIVDPPYTYCRNPMALGAILAYLGIAIWIGSMSAVALQLLFPALLFPYIKLVEEREMAARFGAEYEEYRRRTPFILPRPPKR